MKRIALPLRGAVIPVELQAAYAFAYRQVAAAAQMLNDGFYIEPNIPFPSLLTDAQIQDALAAVARWREALDRVKSTTE